MLFKIHLQNVQHIKDFQFEVDLSRNNVLCLVGKNGCGKTTLVRSIRNLAINDTFQQYGAPHIFNENSLIKYNFGDQEFAFSFNKKLSAIDTRQVIDNKTRQMFGTELPIPHGVRFSRFQDLTRYDLDIRSRLSNGEFDSPNELIAFLNAVYSDNRFNHLKRIQIKQRVFYAVLRDERERFYIREDYLSSGEYFLINLYRYILERRKCIVIDEIDISLDTSAQVNLVRELRRLCKVYEVNIIFTTHSPGQDRERYLTR